MKFQRGIKEGYKSNVRVVGKKKKSLLFSDIMVELKYQDLLKASISLSNNIYQGSIV
jgi:regulation of enolase protein 1 (concanavalin A-like superfamily)